MLSYPTNPEQLEEVKKIEFSLRLLFQMPAPYTPSDLLIARNLTEKYKTLMNWDIQQMSGPIYPTN